MKTLVIYDIVEDKIRIKIANKCKDYGLKPLQYSAYFGELSSNRRDELGQRLRKIIGKSCGRVHIFPLCDKDLRLRLQINVGYPGEEPEEQEC